MNSTITVNNEKCLLWLLNISKKASNSHEEFLNAKSILKIEMKLGEKMSPIMEMISTAFRKYDS